MRILIIIFMLMSFTFNYQISRMNKCDATQSFYSNTEPEKFNKSNNLTRKSAELSPKINKPIYLEINLLDTKCAPITDAKIYLWQASPIGLYNFKPLRSKFEHNDLFNNDSTGFVGSATTISDNLGKARAISLFPGSVEGEHPHINIRVVDMYDQIFETKVYLSRQMRREFFLDKNYPVAKLANGKFKVNIVIDTDINHKEY